MSDVRSYHSRFVVVGPRVKSRPCRTKTRVSKPIIIKFPKHSPEKFLIRPPTSRGSFNKPASCAKLFLYFFKKCEVFRGAGGAALSRDGEMERLKLCLSSHPILEVSPVAFSVPAPALRDDLKHGGY